MEIETTRTPDLSCNDTEEGLEIVDPGVDSWLMRLSSTTAAPSSGGRVLTSSYAAVGALAQSLTPVSALVSASALAGHGLQVAFSPATQAGIQFGALSLMQASKGALPVAVDSAGKIRELAHVVPAGGLIAGPALLPVLVPAAAAAAASYYQHQALQATLDGIREVVDRIEDRLRDDDWAVLETGDELARALVHEHGGWDVPDQLRMELAVARQSVERVFRSRRRFAQQLVAKLDADTFGRSDPWTDEVRKLVKGEHNWIEVSLYLQAMVVRTRLTAATAFVLATDGDARAAASMSTNALTELSESYEPLLRALEPLAGRRPEGRLIDRVPGRKASGEEGFRFVGDLVGEMRTGIGSALESAKGPSTIVLPPHIVKAIAPTA